MMKMSYNERLKLLRIQKYYLVKFNLNYNAYSLRKSVNDLVSAIDEEILLIQNQIKNYKNDKEQLKFNI